MLRGGSTATTQNLGIGCQLFHLKGKVFGIHAIHSLPIPGFGQSGIGLANQRKGGVARKGFQNGSQLQGAKSAVYANG